MPGWEYVTEYLERAVDEEAGVVLYRDNAVDGLTAIPLDETDLGGVEDAAD